MIFQKLIGFIAGLLVSLLLTFLAGENPLHILNIMYNSAFGSLYDFGLTLSYVAPLILTGLSVAIPFQAGLFNIGAEGQLLMGTLGCTVFALSFPDIALPMAPVLALTAGMFTGALWGALVGWLKAYKGSHEVIVTIMMNFIASGITSWAILNLIPSRTSQSPESALISNHYFLKPYDLVAIWFPETPANSTIIFAVAIAILLWIILWKTPFGFELRATGLNPEAASRNGIHVKRVQITAMIIAGCLCSLIGYSEVLGAQGRLRLGFSPDFGFMGIAVAILASNNPIGIIFSAFLLGALQKGASDLDLETATITRDFSKIIQAFVIIFCTVEFYKINKQRKNNNEEKP